jgi:hypothetical protein
VTPWKETPKKPQAMLNNSSRVTQIREKETKIKPRPKGELKKLRLKLDKKLKLLSQICRPPLNNGLVPR